MTLDLQACTVRFIDSGKSGCAVQRTQALSYWYILVPVAPPKHRSMETFLTAESLVDLGLGRSCLHTMQRDPPQERLGAVDIAVRDGSFSGCAV